LEDAGFHLRAVGAAAESVVCVGEVEPFTPTGWRVIARTSDPPQTNVLGPSDEFFCSEVLPAQEQGDGAREGLKSLLLEQEIVGAWRQVRRVVDRYICRSCLWAPHVANCRKNF
jgi:hypothetical protein